MLHPSLMVGQVGSPIPNGQFRNFQTNGTSWELLCERVAGNLSNGIHAGPCVAEGLATRSTPATWGSKRLLATYLQTLLAYPGGRTRGETVFDPAAGVPIVQVPPLSEDSVYPKEQALVDLVAAERLEGRKVLVYATHTGTRNITGRMGVVLTRHGMPVAVPD